MSNEPTNQPFRRIWYRLTHVREQLSYGLLMPLLGVIALIVFAVAERISRDASLQRLTDGGLIDPSALEPMISQTNFSSNLVIALAIIIGVTQALVSLIWSRRVFGPSVALRNHVAKLRKGDFSSRVHLRKYDELVDLASELNELAAELETRTR